MLTIQPLISLLIFISISNPLVFKNIIGIENPSPSLTAFFGMLTVIVSINRVLIIRHTKKYLNPKNLKQIYFLSSLTYILLVVPLSKLLGAHGLVLASILAEITSVLFMRLKGKTTTNN